MGVLIPFPKVTPLPEPSSDTLSFTPFGPPSVTTEEDAQWPVLAEDVVLPRDLLKSLLIINQRRGNPIMPDRTRFSGEILEVTSPSDPLTKFRIKKCGNGENIQRKDLSATIRYYEKPTSTANDAELVNVTEREYPMGTRQLDTIMLVLVGWNITDAGQPVEITAENVVGYTDPDELEFLYEQAMEVNPMWSGVRDRKKN